MGRIFLPQTIGDGRIDIFLKIITVAKAYPRGLRDIKLDWHKTTHITPAGLAILAVLFDTFIEQKNRVQNLHLPKQFLNIPVIRNLSRTADFAGLPKPEINDFEDPTVFIRGKSTSIDPSFTEHCQRKFSGKLPEPILFASALTINELMQNSVDHSSSERYYLYAGIWKQEFHIGLLDMGISIPAKLMQKYICQSDLEYLELSLQKGSSTRRERTGGFGLYYFFEFLKESRGKLTLVSRGAQIRRYFLTRKSQKNHLKYPLPGTWCFARFPLEANPC